MKRILLGAFLMCSMLAVTAQEKNAVIDNMIKEANENSQLEILGHELLDVIGPRLVGTPEMKQAHDWAVGTYEKWGIPAKNEQYGEWKAWQRGVSHIDMESKYWSKRSYRRSDYASNGERFYRI